MPVAASPSPSPGTALYVAEARVSGIFRGDVQAIPASMILKIGRDQCGYFAAGGSYFGIILDLTKHNPKPTTRQATAEVNAAIRDLCPRYSALIRGGTLSRPGRNLFLAQVRDGVPALAAVPAAPILKVGRKECEALSLVPGNAPAVRTQAISDLASADALTSHEAALLVDSAIRNLCPQYSSAIPAGAP